MRKGIFATIILVILTAPAFAESLGIGGFYSLGYCLHQVMNPDTGKVEYEGISPIGFGARIYYKVIPLLSVNCFFNYQRYGVSFSNYSSSPLILGMGINLHFSKAYFGVGPSWTRLTGTIENRSELGFFLNGGVTFPVANSIDLNLGMAFNQYSIFYGLGSDINIRVGVDYVVF